MIFPVKGGDFNAANRKLRKHARTPSASNEKIFIKACRNGEFKAKRLFSPRIIFLLLPVYSVQGKVVGKKRFNFLTVSELFKYSSGGKYDD